MLEYNSVLLGECYSDIQYKTKSISSMFIDDKNKSYKEKSTVPTVSMEVGWLRLWAVLLHLALAV